MKKIGIYGSGQIGKNLALKFTGIGVNTVIFTRNKDKTLNEMKLFVKLAQKMNKDLNLVDNHVLITDDLDQLKDCDLIIESVNEKIEVKKEVLLNIDKISNENTIIGTTTSTKSITELSQHLKYKENFLGLHFFNPPTLINFLEIIKGEYTSEEALNAICSFFENNNMKYLQINKENPGFIVNRALFLMLNETIYELDEQLATAKEIDMAFKLGLNHPMGPLELCDFIGLDIVLDILTTLYEEYNDTKYRPCYLLKQKVRANKLGKKSKEGFYKYK